MSLGTRLRNPNVQTGQMITEMWLPFLKRAMVVWFQWIMAKWELLPTLLIYQKKTEIYIYIFNI